MVRLSRIYTRLGDNGDTGLIGGSRVPKHHARIEAIGAVDEANSAIGIARLHVKKKTDAMLARIQQDLFDLGADLAMPVSPAKANKKPALRIISAQVKRLEREIDVMNAKLKPLGSFVLPGGSKASAHLHLARSLARRAERSITTLMNTERINPIALHYINRLSDHLFVLARFLNEKGKKDVLWQPGLNREIT